MNKDFFQDNNSNNERLNYAKLAKYLSNRNISNLFTIVWIINSVLLVYSTEGVAWFLAPMYCISLLLGAVLSAINIKLKKFIVLIFEFIVCIGSIIMFFIWLTEIGHYSINSIVSLILLIFITIICLIKIILSYSYLKKGKTNIFLN